MPGLQYTLQKKFQGRLFLNYIFKPRNNPNDFLIHTGRPLNFSLGTDNNTNTENSQKSQGGGEGGEEGEGGSSLS